MTWTGQSFNVGQVLTAAQMTNLQADITAAFNQDSGAPAPTTDFISLQAQVADDVVGRGELYTSTTSLAGSLNVAGYTDIVLGAAYVFFPMIHAIDGAGTRAAVHGDDTDGANPDSPRLSFLNPTGSSGSYDIDFRYVRT